MPAPRVLSKLKQTAIALHGNPAGPRTILFGLNRGVRMDLDLASETQTYLGIAERELASSFEALARGAETALDVGGAVGFYSLFFLQRAKVKRLLCFEPDPACLAKIRANFALNGVLDDPRVELVPKLVGGVTDERHVALDSYADTLKTPCVIKVDVEGAEADVLRGASRLLANPSVRWIVETHAAALETECLEIFRQAHRSPHVIDKAWWRVVLPELRPLPHNRWIVVG